MMSNKYNDSFKIRVLEQDAEPTEFYFIWQFVPTYVLLKCIVVKFRAAPFDICIYSINCLVLLLPSLSPPPLPSPGRLTCSV